MTTLPLFGAEYTIEKHFSPKGQIILHHGDVNAFLPTLPDKSVSLIITSPPYNLGKDYEQRDLQPGWGQRCDQITYVASPAVRRCRGRSKQGNVHRTPVLN